MNKLDKLADIFVQSFPQYEDVLIASDDATAENQLQTNAVFSDKWVKYSKEDFAKQECYFESQKKWYLELYGFACEEDLQSYLQKQEIVLDAGCGLGFKAKWFADLSPRTLVVGMDYSNASFVAARKYAGIPNLAFVKGDIGETRIKDGVVSYVSCDQVIHHTEDPQKTMIELSRILKPQGELAVYVYAKKALPRELLDDYFRVKTKSTSNEDMWKMSEQLTELGKRLSDLSISINVPDIPLLGIKGGEMDIQRFIYWNFLKCFWDQDLGKETSIFHNYDWYAPSNAERYSQYEFLEMTKKSGLKITTLHTEKACHSGRFVKARQ